MASRDFCRMIEGYGLTTPTSSIVFPTIRRSFNPTSGRNTTCIRLSRTAQVSGLLVKESGRQTSLGVVAHARLIRPAKFRWWTLI